MSIVEFFWRLLPDRCQVDGCSRRGVRGNENVINGRIVCDYCHSEIIAAAGGRWREMSDEEVDEAARSDPDNPPLSEADFARMKPRSPR